MSTMRTIDHDWKLVSPSYRTREGERPVFQKYNTPDLVNAFLKDPRRSLAFNEDDRYYTVSNSSGRMREVDTGKRKLFLDLHARSYLVVCEVQCDAPGKPRVSRDHICEAGFVVRRFTGKQWQAWIPSPFDGIGAWTDVEHEDELSEGEETFPLSALVPDPRDQAHPGQKRTVYFGIVPTASADTEDDGKSRFSDDYDYRIHCYVRRHQEGCPRTELGRDCKGPVTWSAPTETYRLAAHFDLVGTGNRPVNMRLPDIAQLEAQANSKPFGFGAPFRMEAGGNNNMAMQFDDEGEPLSSGFNAQSCQFAIPLITLVATFVLKLFLPVLMFMMGLWFMLKFKFCLPFFGADANVSQIAEVSLKAEMGAATPEPPRASAKLEIEASAEASA